MKNRRPLSSWLATCMLLLSLAHASGQETRRAEPSQSFPFRMNTIGFLPDGPKRISIAAPASPFKVIRLSDDQVFFDGNSSDPIHNADTREDLSQVDISAITEPGRYRVEVAGLGESPEFTIASDVYNLAFYTVFRGMYLARCGLAVSGDHNGRHYHHAACHLEDAHTDFVESDAGHRRSTGGWHDAGDYNKYIVNAGITVGMMIKGWEHFRDRVANLDLDLPESNNNVPDYLDEIKWEIDWLLTTQLSDGSVSHKISTKKFGGFMAPEDEIEPRYFVPWSSAATADFVAMTAASARVFREYDKAFSDRCVAAAKKSYQFLVEHPEEHRPDQGDFSTGGYGAPDGDDRLWAAVELWETTGDEACLKDFESRMQKQLGRRSRRPVVDFNWDWGDVSNLALFTYLESQREGRSPKILERITADVIKVADEVVTTAESHGYGRPLGRRYYWGCNGTVARMAMVLEAANRLQPSRKYKATTLAAIDHIFGRNCYGRSFVTGLGFEPPKAPHDRRNGINGFPDPWPGYLVGGPWPTAKDWRDDQDDYRTNEIAINWNGALIYALAGFVEPEPLHEISVSP